MKREKKKVLPLTKDNKVTGLYIFTDLKRIKSGESKNYNTDKKGQLRVGAAMGVGEDAKQRAELLTNKNVDVLVIDTAHGDTKLVIETLKEIKQTYNVEVVVGNISEPSSANRLAKAGADGIKTGQGPGAICTTRIIAGIGCPQVTAIYKCAKETDLPICADGGLRFSGDIPIALGAGASSVMMGSMLAGTKEAPGSTIFLKGKRWKTYRGMGSLEAMKDNPGSRERYSQGKSEFIPEGVEGLVPYKGDLKEVLQYYIGGLKRGMGYTGSPNINELRKNADFIRISSSGQKESHPHDIQITKESPNYPGGI